VKEICIFEGELRFKGASPEFAADKYNQTQ
jgi:hypothetical protein